MARLLLLAATVTVAGTVFVGAGAGAPPGDSSGVFGVLDVQSAALIGSNDDVFATNSTPSDPGATHFGPYPSNTTDSGTCGPDWADDMVTRDFTIQQTGPMDFRVIEKFKDGTFSTFPGPSPGACDSSDGTGPGIVNSGVTGTFHGYDMIAVTSPTYHPETAACPYPCDTTQGFLESVFGPVFTRDDYAYFFHYVSNDHTLVYHEWKNASCNRGGNHGDIQSAGAVFAETATCP